MILRKKTNNAVLVDAHDMRNDYVYMTISAVLQVNQGYQIKIAYSYVLDENKPESENFFAKKDLNFTVPEYIQKEIDLGGCEGSNQHEKNTSFINKIIEDYLDTENPFGITSSDWTNQ